MASSDPSSPPLAPWARRELPGTFTVAETARRIGHYKWLEMRIFELLGTWVSFVPELEIKLVLGTHCYHHSFHAELWHKRLPELWDADTEPLTRPPGPGVEVVLDATTAPEATLERLVGFYRVLLPYLVSAYTYHLHQTSHVGDAPTIRALELCLADDGEEWREGEMMIQSLLTGPEEVARAIRHQAELTEAMVAAGGVVGPGSVGAYSPTEARWPPD